jgi:TorA maturation chaperone TorD
MMGGSTLEVKGIYREAGLDMADDFQNPPDHITAELEFLAYLAANQSEVRQAGDLVGAQRLGQLAQRFMAGHIGAWIEPFTSRIKAGAATGFYQTLGRLTPKVVLCAGTRLVPPDAGTTSG